MSKRFFTPNIAAWKYVQAKPRKFRFGKRKKLGFAGIDDSNFDKMISNSTELVDFAISFTKTVVRISFVLFVVVNLYILIMTTIHYFQTNELLFIDTLITESYGMLRDVIAAYIIKAATENSLRIAFSVLSDYLNKKYDIKVKPNQDDSSYDYNEYDDSFTDVDIPEDDEDPGNDQNNPLEEDMGGLDIISKGR